MYAVGPIWCCLRTRSEVLTFSTKYFLAVLVSIQLSIFILVNAMALWVDQLLHGAINKLSSHTTVYDGTFIFTIVVRFRHRDMSIHLG